MLRGLRTECNITLNRRVRGSSPRQPTTEKNYAKSRLAFANAHAGACFFCFAPIENRS